MAESESKNFLPKKFRLAQKKAQGSPIAIAMRLDIRATSMVYSAMFAVRQKLMFVLESLAHKGLNATPKGSAKDKIMSMVKAMAKQTAALRI